MVDLFKNCTFSEPGGRCLWIFQSLNIYHYLKAPANHNKNSPAHQNYSQSPDLNVGFYSTSSPPVNGVLSCPYLARPLTQRYAPFIDSLHKRLLNS